ncbi:MAG: rRNA maturation RNase YbeY [Treponema sp.]|jgi:probable rRNA maturation factor|nr:rRNA maturation RNase YbeY [Treponema sp.]
MNRVAINAAEVPVPQWTGEAYTFMLKVLDYIHRDNWDLSVLFCNDAYIRHLNAQYRNKDEPTDVLSFALGETVEERYLPGDIVISLETLGENAGYFKVSEDEELRRLLIHGILHLDGLDHATNAHSEPMLELQEKIMTNLAGERILP